MGECKDCDETLNKGNRGPRGFRGEQGPAGPAGSGSSIQGPQGPQGDPGLTGPAGTNGKSAYEIWKLLPGNSAGTPQDFIDSLKGAGGTSPTMLVGTVTAGSVPAVNAVTVGTTVTLNFVLAQGPTGLTGAQGNDGVQGNPGANSLTYKRFPAITTLGSWSDNTGNFETLSVININTTSMAGYTGIAAVSMNADNWTHAIVKNAVIQITSRVDSSKFGIYRVDSIVDNTTYLSFTVTKISAHGLSSTALEESTISYVLPGIDTTTPGLYSAMPTGVVVPFAGKTAASIPAGWLLCDGSLLSQTAYPDLFSVIGYEYDLVVPPVGLFSLPNLIDAIPYGSDATNVGTVVGSNVAAITVTGTATVSISIANLPSHTHGVTGLTIASGGNHRHYVRMRTSGTTVSNNHAGIDSARGSEETNGLDNSGNSNNGPFTDGAVDFNDGAHTHSFTGSIDSTGTAGSNNATGTIAGTGTGDNRQKGISMRYIIKY